MKQIKIIRFGLRILVILLLVKSPVSAQDFENIKFGKISPSDFNVTATGFDTGANAVIIKDFGKTEFVGNGSGFFSIIFTRFIRVKILNKNGYDAADFRVLLLDLEKKYFEKIKDVRGSTYNLENGQIKEDKLDSKSIFTEKYSRDFNIAKFTLPSLKEGSVFDVSYTIESNYFAEPPNWSFQGEYPCLWSEYIAIIPSPFHYLVQKKGNDHYDINTSKSVRAHFTVNEESEGLVSAQKTLDVFGTSFQHRWVKKNVSALKVQPYISAMKNYVSQIGFILDYFQQDDQSPKQMQRISWSDASHNLLLAANFGSELSLENHYMDEDLKKVINGASNSSEIIQRIYDFVRDNFVCTSRGGIYISTSIRTVFEKRTGNAAELNLLLVALLRHQNINADPAILSTRSNGIAQLNYAFLYEYNHVICIAHTPENVFRLDASSVFNPFDQLPAYCYNWGARVINEQNPVLIQLSPDSVSETRMTNAIFINDDKGVCSGNVTVKFGNNRAFEIREMIKASSQKDFFKSVQMENGEMKHSNEILDSLSHVDFPLTLHYDVDFKDLNGKDILYFTPVLEPYLRKNVLKDADRAFPVEMTHTIDDTYVLSMEVPKGFQVDELPKSARVAFSENMGKFEYLIQQTDNNIQMKVHLKINAATFKMEEYNDLRDFFAYVVKKESEQIVFKRIK